MEQSRVHITHWFKQAGAAGCFLLLSFVLYIQAFHHHHDAVEADQTTHVKKLETGKGHCSICDHIQTRSVSGEPERISYSLTPPLPQAYNLYSYYITIDRALFLQAYTNKGPPSFTVFAV